MVAASLKQTYHANYLFNPMNDFELTALEDPLTVAYLISQREKMKSRKDDFYYWDEVRGKLVKKERYIDQNMAGEIETQAYSSMPDSLDGLIAFTGSINATLNYWG